MRTELELLQREADAAANDRATYNLATQQLLARYCGVLEQTTRLLQMARRKQQLVGTLVEQHQRLYKDRTLEQSAHNSYIHATNNMLMNLDVRLQLFEDMCNKAEKLITQAHNLKISSIQA